MAKPKTQADANLEAITGGAGRYFGPTQPNAGFIRAPVEPGPPQSVEEMLKQENYARQLEDLRWQQLNPREQIGEYANTIMDLVDMPKMAGTALVTGSPQTVEALLEGLDKLRRYAPESKLGKWASQVMNRGNLDDVIEGLKNLPPSWAKQFEKVGIGKPLGALSGTGRQTKAWIDLEKNAPTTKVHEPVHAWWAQLEDAAKNAWKETVTKKGRHPRVPKSVTDPETVANESLAETLVDLLVRGKTAAPGLVNDLRMMLGR